MKRKTELSLEFAYISPYFRIQVAYDWSCLIFCNSYYILEFILLIFFDKFDSLTTHLLHLSFVETVHVRPLHLGVFNFFE